MCAQILLYPKPTKYRRQGSCKEDPARFEHQGDLLRAASSSLMNGTDMILKARDWLGRRWSENQSPERERVLTCAVDALLFLTSTGIVPRFDDYRQMPQVSDAPHEIARHLKDANISPKAAALVELMARTEGFLQILLERDEDQEYARVVVDALRFIVAENELMAFGEFVESLAAGDPPRVVAAFDTLTEAEAWLAQLADPPTHGHLLVGDAYHQFVCARDMKLRRVHPWPAMEYYLAELRQDVPPTAVASFGTLSEAQAWYAALVAPPKRAWVLAEGQLYLAVNHANVNRRSLYPLSMADGYYVNYEVESETTVT